MEDLHEANAAALSEARLPTEPTRFSLNFVPLRWHKKEKIILNCVYFNIECPVWDEYKLLVPMIALISMYIAFKLGQTLARQYFTRIFHNFLSYQIIEHSYKKYFFVEDL